MQVEGNDPEAGVAMNSILALISLYVAHQHSRQQCLKEFPAEYVVGWLLITICSFMGLFFLSLYGSCFEHPSFETVCLEPQNHVKPDGPKNLSDSI